MNIIYVAFPCNPYVGSESKIGWNIPIESVKQGNNVTVFTIKDMKSDIENYIKKNGDINIDFHYVDLPKAFKKFLKKLPTIKLRAYHRLIYRKIKEFLKDGKNIDIIHQITPVEFRNIGNYYKIKNTKFIVGPVGGGEYIPKSLKYYSKKHLHIEIVRRLLNIVSKWCLKINKTKIKNTIILYANSETKNYLNIKSKYNIITPEIGVKETEFIKNTISKKEKEEIVFIVCGRLVYRKGHEFLLDTLKGISKEYDYKVRIIGRGIEHFHIKEMINNDKYLKKHVEIVGSISFDRIKEEYKNADVLIMPSLRETTGSVILEAMSKGVPVITMNQYGAKEIVNDGCGYTYSGTNKNEIMQNLRECIIDCIEDRSKLSIKKNLCINEAYKYLWRNKVIYYNEIYKNTLKND